MGIARDEKRIWAGRDEKAKKRKRNYIRAKIEFFFRKERLAARETSRLFGQFLRRRGECRKSGCLSLFTRSVRSGKTERIVEALKTSQSCCDGKRNERDKKGERERSK